MYFRALYYLILNCTIFCYIMAYHGKSLEALANWIQLYSTICILWKIRYDMLLLLLLLPPLLPLALLSLPLLPQLPLLLLPLLLFPLLLLPLLLAIFFGTRSPKHCAFDAGLAACMCNTKQQPITLHYFTIQHEYNYHYVQLTLVHYITHSILVHSITFHDIEPHYIILIALHIIALHDSGFALHYIALNRITLHYICTYITYDI